MSKFRILLGFAKLPDSHLDDFATKVAGCLAQNAALFPGLPVSVADLTAAQDQFHVSLSVAKDGGKADRTDKKAKRVLLAGLLRQDALFIQGIPGMTPEKAGLSGYVVKVAGAPGPVRVETPVILAVTNPAPAKLGIRLQGVKGAKAYEFRVSVGGQAPVLAGTFPSTRGIELEDLLSGTLYAIQVRGVFGNKRYSEWSDAVNHRCT